MRKKGFTLIELLLVLSIISIILGIGVLRFDIVEKFKADMEIQTMINDIDHAKIKAMTSGINYTIYIKADSYEVKSSNGKADRPIVRQLKYISFPEITSAGYTINFTSTGASSNPGTLRFYSKYGDQEKLAKLVITVAGGHSRVENEEKDRIHFN